MKNDAYIKSLFNDDNIKKLVDEALVKIPNEHLLQELIEYSNKLDTHLKEARILRIWRQCLLSNHLTIAEKIRVKYGITDRRLPHNDPYHHDIVVAMGIAMLSNKDDNTKTN